MSETSGEERFDIYDDNLVKIGIKPRSQVHRDGDWHRSFHGWVIYRDAAGVDWMLLQKRAPDKDLYPNLFDISCAGHYSTGEDLATTARRELQEELGLTVAYTDLIPVGLRVSTKAPEPGKIDREINDVFLLVHPAPLTAYQPNEELSGLALIQIADGLALCAGERESIPAVYLMRGGVEPVTVAFRLADFVPSPDAYLYRVLVTAQRCLNGERHLVV